MFFEKGIRRGRSQVSTNYSKRSYKYLTSYNPKIPIKYITYLDKNSLCGYVMSISLPRCGYKMLNPINLTYVSMMITTPEVRL